MLTNKTKTVCFLLIALLPCFSLSAMDWQKFIPSQATSTDNVFYGPVTKNNYHARQLTVYGPLSLTDSEIDETLTVYGLAVIKRSKIHGATRLFGTMIASNSTFNAIDASTNELKLIDTKVNNIVIYENSEPHKRQTLHLTGHTVVSGSIKFEQGNGRIILEPSAKVLGEIVGGEIIKQ